MPQTTATILQVTINGVIYQQSASLSSDSLELVNPTVPAAKSGTLTVRTDDNTGSLTMASGHGITTGQKLSIFWSGGSRSNVTAGTVATNVVPIDMGSGDNLPDAATAITAMVATSVAAAIEGDDVDAFAVSCPTAVSGWVVFKASGGTIISEHQIPSGTKAKTWASGLGITNPLAGATVDTIEFSHGSTSAQDMTAAVVF